MCIVERNCSFNQRFTNCQNDPAGLLTCNFFVGTSHTFIAFEHTSMLLGYWKVKLKLTAEEAVISFKGAMIHKVKFIKKKFRNVTIEGSFLNKNLNNGIERF